MGIIKFIIHGNLWFSLGIYPYTCDRYSVTHSACSVACIGYQQRVCPILCCSWPPLMLRLAKDLAVDMDLIRRHHVVQLYTSGQDKLAEEVMALYLSVERLKGLTIRHLHTQYNPFASKLMICFFFFCFVLLVYIFLLQITFVATVFL